MLASTTLVAAAAGTALIAACIDVASLRIPNWISIGLSTLFLAFAMTVHMTMGDVFLHFGMGALMLVIGMALFAGGVLGGGDAKLLAAVALWLGWPMLLPGLLLIAIFGGVLAVAILMLRRTGLDVWLRVHGYDSVVLEQNKGIPYGVAIATGFTFLILQRPTL
jgi:prepilin peptidase CpaA